MGKKGTLFEKPAGPSEYLWSNLSMGTTSAVRCGLCGTQWPEMPPYSTETYTRGIFLGIDFVEECCGAAVDTLYGEFGAEFVIRFLEEFAKDPFDSRFGLFRSVLKDSLEKARQKSEAMAAETKRLQRQLV